MLEKYQELSKYIIFQKIKTSGLELINIGYSKQLLV